MKSEAAEEAIEAVCSPSGKVIAEAVAVHIHAAVLVWKRWNSALWILIGESFVEEDEVGEAAADGGFGSLKGREIGLLALALLKSNCDMDIRW